MSLLTRHDVPDALFATDNPLGIPMLDLALQADYVHLPWMTWGTVKRNQRMPGTWHFYTEDYRYEALWSDPSVIVNSACEAIVEPNFTTSEQMPNAVGWYQVYRKRWLARYWQTQGIRVFVDMNVAPPFYVVNLLGVPAGWKAYATRGYSDRLDWLDVEYALACEKAESSDILFVVYGGGMEVEARCQERTSERQFYSWVPECMDVRNGRK